MKKFKIILFLCISVCNYIFASAAYPGPYLKIQPNGDSIYIYFNGDEHSRAFYTDGKRKEVARNGEGYWVYVTKINGKRFLTDQIVSKTSTFKEVDKKTVLTGVKPTGTPHLGNYLGAIKPAIDLGNKAENQYMFIADYHAINAEKDPQVLNQKIKEVACTYLALGLNPNHSGFYRQSDIPEITEITTILYAYTPKGFMNKAHAYKACVDKNREAGKPFNRTGIVLARYLPFR